MFRLDDEFLQAYRSRAPGFGFGGLGAFTYERTYARLKPSGAKESWVDTCERVTNGTFRIQERHIERSGLGWDAGKAQRSAQEFFDRMFTMKFLPPGRGLWAMGSPIIEEKGISASLENCAFQSTEHIDKDFAKPFCFMMDASMLGVGVGFNVAGAGKAYINKPTGPERVFTIPDSREGWIESLRLLLDSYVKPNIQHVVTFDYSAIRAAGAPIKTFGGISAGPAPLKEMHESIRKVLDGLHGKKITTRAITDIMNLIGRCVVSGNVRRCLPQGTIVHTTRGAVPIEDISVGDIVVTVKGQAPVVKVFDQGVQDTIIIEHEFGTFECTPTHRVAVFNSLQGWEFKPANALKPNDLLVFDALGYDGTVQELPPYNIEKSTHDTTSQSVNIPPLTPEIAWLIGLVHGDGYVKIPKVNAKKLGMMSNGMISIACHTQEKNTIDKAVTAFQKFGVRVHVKTYGNLTIVHVCSTGLARYFAEHVKTPKTPMKIPSWIRNASREIRGAYLAGVFDADGSNDRPLCLASTIYHEFSQGLQSLCQSLGILATNGWTRPAVGNWKPLYHVSIRGYENKENFSTSCGVFSTRYVRQNMSKSQGGHRFPRELVEKECVVNVAFGAGNASNITTHRISKNTRIVFKALPVTVLGISSGKSCHTFDVEVRDIHQFTANGFVVHNSAQLNIGPASGEYLDLKNYLLNPERAAFGWTSNNSVYAELGMDYSEVAKRVRDNGEPGLVWLHNIQNYERMNGKLAKRVDKATGLNPCAEQPLEHGELCTLVETFPARHDSEEDYLRTLKFAYLYGKTVTLSNTHWVESNRVMMRNRRIGVSMSGIAQFIGKFGLANLRQWCDDGYEEVQYYDQVYSDWLAIPRSIRTNTIKPSGTVSLLAGATPGIHFPESRYYIRRVRVGLNDPLLQQAKSAGYVIEVPRHEPNTAIVCFPVDSGVGVRAARDVSMWEQLSLAALLQRVWSDNAVSCTVGFNAAEGRDLCSALDLFQYQLKSISFLPRIEKGAYEHMPYEAIDADAYQVMAEKVKPVFQGGSDAVGEKFCSNDVCQI